MNRYLSSPQTLLFALALLIGAVVRLGNLGTTPLTDNEAELALQALQIAQGKATAIQSYPLEVLASAALFFLFGSNNFWARFPAAFSGTLLLLGVVSLRRYLGVPLTLVLSFALALDPAMVAQSRQMGSVMPAMAALGAVALFANQARWGWMGIALGLGILSGPSFWHGGLLLLLLAGVLLMLKKRLPSTSGVPSFAWPQILPANPQEGLRAAAGSVLLTLLLGSTLLFFYPRGLGSILSPLLTYLDGWTKSSSVSIPYLLLTLGAYHPLAILFAGISTIRAFIGRQLHETVSAHRQQHLLVLWLGIALLLALVYPARQVATLTWVVLPLWVLAAEEIARWVERLEQPGWATCVLGGLTFTFLALFWLQLAAYSLLVAYGITDWLRFATVFSSLALIALLVWLAELLWSPRLAWQGLILGTLVALSLYTISATRGVAFSYPWSEVFQQELWKPYPQVGDADLLLKTVHDLSRRESGRADSLPIVLAANSPALRWLLRHQVQVIILPEDQALAELSLRQTSQLPALLITSAVTESPALAAAYRGQDFNWQYRPNWRDIPPNPLNWLLFRRGTWEIQPLVLWARADLFPEGQTFNAGQGSSPPATPSEEFPLEHP